MSKVSKLAIKACSDNKFSSFTGEFNTSINPEHLIIKSGITYHIPQGMAGSNLMQYRDSPPKLLSFSLLFDNTGIIPGSNTIPVMEQVKQLQDVVYNVHKTNNGPNYIRVIWGEVDFKGRLVELDITYTRFQVDGMVVRAEAHIAVLEEIVPSGRGQTAVGVDSNYVQLQGSAVQVPHKSSHNDVFAPTSDGMEGAYSGAPEGAYEGSPDAPYQGSTDGAAATQHMEGNAAASGIGTDSGTKSGSDLSAGSTAGAGQDSVTEGGVAGNGPGGSGGGIGGGGNEAGSGAHKLSGDGTNLDKDYNKMIDSSGKAGIGGSSGNLDSLRKLKTVGTAGLAAASTAGMVGLAGKLALSKIKDKLSWWNRLKMLAKKVAPKAYSMGKSVGNKGRELGKKAIGK